MDINIQQELPLSQIWISVHSLQAVRMIFKIKADNWSTGLTLHLIPRLGNVDTTPDTWLSALLAAHNEPDGDF